MPLRFAVVISHPIQHLSPIFRELAKVPGVQVKVFYACDHGARESYDPGFGHRFAWDVPLLDGYDYEFLRPGYSPERFGFWEMDSPALPARLDEFRPHALWVHGYGQRQSWRAVRWARGRAAVIYFGDSELLHDRSLAARAGKRLTLGWFFRQCDAIITIGDHNEAYYAHYGTPPEKLFRGAYPVDFSRFQAALAAPGQPDAAAMRRRYGLPADAFVAMTMGKLEPRKRPGDLVAAIAALRRRSVPAAALFIGEGALRAAVEQQARQAGVAEWVRITGFVNQRDIPLALQAGDAMVMMSDYDPHPLAVTEALILGKPIIGSDRIGCVGPTDTARPGVNALVYPCGDAAALADAIARLAADESLRRRLGEASLAIAPTQDVSVTVGAVLTILAALQPRFAARWDDLPPEMVKF